MDVAVVEVAAADGVEDDVGGGVGGEPDETAAAFFLELTGFGEAAFFF